MHFGSRNKVNHARADMGVIGALALLAVISVVHTFGPKTGPYRIDIYKLEPCENPGTNEVYFKTRINHGGKGKYYFRDHFYFAHPADEHFTMKFKLQKLGNGGWKEFTKVTFKGCEKIWKVNGHFLKSLFKSAGVDIEKCPVPAGNYTANDWLIELNLERTAPVMEYGEYRMVFNFERDETLVGCLHVYTNAVPK